MSKILLNNAGSLLCGRKPPFVLCPYICLGRGAVKRQNTVKGQLYFHSAVEELLNYFPRSTLPIKYGGTLTDYYLTDYLKRANEEQGDFPAGGLKNLF
uniref:CRAL-TRIO domain-containing protein n=1 Tax=Araneus ventricosus TaxID=182803 RepID=A0A4Y2L1D2_ARAVE|nr:hypothetical protein AVEN_1952-1 [Araneus ventricosus]GBN07667.1 hypothetical protein AVEN_42415-1 [Araneus ventricosus]